MSVRGRGRGKKQTGRGGIRDSSISSVSTLVQTRHCVLNQLPSCQIVVRVKAVFHVEVLMRGSRTASGMKNTQKVQNSSRITKAIIVAVFIGTGTNGMAWKTRRK